MQRLGGGTSVTKSDWLSWSDPEPMLAFLDKTRQSTTRMYRLFATACCRRVWPLLSDDRSRWAVEVAELYANREAEPKELYRAFLGSDQAYRQFGRRRGMNVVAFSAWLAASAARAAAMPINGYAHGKERIVTFTWKVAVRAVAIHPPPFGPTSTWRPTGATTQRLARAEQVAQAGLLRCLVRNPFTPRSP
jgi:hypothetical protein